MTIGGIISRTLSDEEKDLYKDTMAKATPIVKDAANRLTGGRVSVFRREYVRGNLDGKIKSKEIRAMQAIKNIEYPVLQGYCRLVLDTVKKYRPNGSSGQEDYIQEGLWAISDSMYIYDGSTEFSTYVMTAIRNRLRDYWRIHAPLSPIPKDMLKKQKVIKQKMAEGYNFAQAAELLGFSEDVAKNCEASMVNVVNQYEVYWDEFVSQIDFSGHEEKSEYDVEQVYKAVESAPLSDFERDVFMSTIRDGRGAKTKVAEEYNYTRMAGSLAYNRALKIVKETLNQLRAA